MDLEKAKLDIKETKKGYAVNLIFETGRSLTVSDMKLQDDKLHGRDVEVYREKGQVKKILHDGKPLYDKTASIGTTASIGKTPQNNPLNTPRVDRNQRRPSTEGYLDEAFAPYNFVPLNDRVVPAEKIPEFDIYHNDRYTGYIDLEIETKTPLYIRDTLNPKEMKEKAENERQIKDGKTREVYVNPDFFSPGDIVRIPGSSLRGMIRTMVEIVSWGKFGFFDDKRLYYRGLADMSSLRKEYQQHMSSFDINRRKTTYKMSAGYLYKEGLRYYIEPAVGFHPIPKKKAREYLRERYQTFTFHKVEDGYIVISGDMQNKKHDWLIKGPNKDAMRINVLPADIQDYKNDSGRHKDVPNLLKLASEGKVPCFYIRYRDKAGQERVSFGHTAIFRLAYEKTIGDHIPGQLKDERVNDIANAIFGNEKDHASRVFFEDALWEGRKEDVLMGEVVPKILSTPKPTTFQHYLEQREDNLKDHPKNLAHYNSANPIRGYKLYWHRDASDWITDDKEQIMRQISQYTKINPVKPGVTFKGRIRFENLSEVELGALLFALDLPSGCCHKLGMGKPLGLGSINIKPTLFISDRTARYSSLTAEWEDLRSTDLNPYKKTFEDYILRNINDNTKQGLWQTDRLKELKAMLDFQNKPDNEKTRYMEIERLVNGKKTNEYKTRLVLKRPTLIKGN